MRQSTNPHSALDQLIQSRGALFAIEKGSEIFVAASENAHIFAGSLSHVELLGRPVVEWLGRQVAHALRNAEAHPSLGRRRQYLGQFELAAGYCDLTVIGSGSLLILEMVPSTGGRVPSAIEILKDVQFLSDVLQDGSEAQVALQRLVSLMKTISGFHCVSLDVFADGNFVNFAVAGTSEFASACGVATPQLHVIEDVDARTARLSTLPGHTVPSLEATLLAAPAESVLEIMRRAGVAACTALRLDSNGQARGRLSFLHAAPRAPSKRTELTLAHILPLVGVKLSEL